VRREEAPAPPKADAPAPPAAIPQQAIFDARVEVHAIAVADAVETYIADLVFATRYPERYGDDLKRRIQVGASPRGSLALDRCARAHAWLARRDHVTPDDVRAIATDVSAQLSELLGKRR
jgi:MoxR-like ATPase